MKNEVRLIGGQWKRTKLPVADRPGLREWAYWVDRYPAG